MRKELTLILGTKFLDLSGTTRVDVGLSMQKTTERPQWMGRVNHTRGNRGNIQNCECTCCGSNAIFLFFINYIM